MGCSCRLDKLCDPRELIIPLTSLMWDSFVAQLVKESVCNAREVGLIPGWERYPGEGNGKPL